MQKLQTERSKQEFEHGSSNQEVLIYVRLLDLNYFQLLGLHMKMLERRG